MVFGVTSAGFVQKRLSDVLASIQATQESSFGASIMDKVTASVISQLNAAYANEVASIWQLAQDVYSSSYPSTAGGTQLALLGLLTGASPLQATQSWTVEVFVGTNGSAVPANTLLAVSGTNALFQPMTALTIVTTPAWAGSTAYSAGTGATAALATVGSLVNNGGKIYYCVQSGTSAGAGGPTGTGTNIADGTCLWNYVATATAAVAGIVQSQKFDAIPAAAYTLTILQTSVGGVTSVTNPIGATLGSLAETDAAFRIRRAQLVRAQGNGTIAAITSKLLQVTGVTQCVVINNPTAFVVNGQPANSFAPYVVGGSNQDIFDAIAKAQPGGIQSYGSITGNGTDANGIQRSEQFSRATITNIYMAVTLTSNAGYTGAASVRNALAAFGNSLYGGAFGGTVIANKFYNAAYNGTLGNAVGGVVEITALNIGLAPSPVSAADIPIGTTALASFNSANILINGA